MFDNVSLCLAVKLSAMRVDTEECDVITCLYFFPNRSPSRPLPRPTTCGVFHLDEVHKTVNFISATSSQGQVEYTNTAVHSRPTIRTP